MTKVLTPLTTPPMNPPPEETMRPPTACMYSRAFCVRLSQSICCSASHSWMAGRTSERSLIWVWSRAKAAGI